MKRIFLNIVLGFLLLGSVASDAARFCVQEIRALIDGSTFSEEKRLERIMWLNLDAINHADEASLRLSNSEIDFLSTPLNLERASAADRLSSIRKNPYPNSLDKQSYEEALAMDLLEKRGLLASPVTRSLLQGTDVKAGLNEDVLRFSMKAIYDDTLRPLEPSLERTHHEILKLSAQNEKNDAHMIHLIVDLKNIENPALVGRIKSELLPVYEKLQQQRQNTGFAPVRLVFVDPPAR